MYGEDITQKAEDLGRCVDWVINQNPLRNTL